MLELKVAAPLVPVVVSVILGCFVANLVVRLSKVVSVNSIITVRSAETVPVVVIGLGLTVMPVPPEMLVSGSMQILLDEL